EVCELLDVAVSARHAGAMAFPDERGITGCGILFRGMNKRGVPAPCVSAGDLHAALGQPERRRATHTATARDIVGLAVARPRGRVDEHDVEGLECNTDALQLSLDVTGRRDIAIR